MMICWRCCVRRRGSASRFSMQKHEAEAACVNPLKAYFHPLTTPWPAKFSCIIRNFIDFVGFFAESRRIFLWLPLSIGATQPFSEDCSSMYYEGNWWYVPLMHFHEKKTHLGPAVTLQRSDPSRLFGAAAATWKRNSRDRVRESELLY